MELLKDNPEFKPFIEFAPILTKEQRIAFVQYIEGRLEGQIAKSTKETGSSIESGLYQQFESLLSNPDLSDACMHHPEIARDVAINFINAIARASKEGINSHPFQEEENKFNENQEKAQNTFVNEYDVVDGFLSNIYSSDEINLPFYTRAARELKDRQVKISSSRKKKKPIQEEIGVENKPTEEPLFKDIKSKADLNVKIQGFKKEMMKDWGGLLEKKIQDYILAEIDKARESYCKKLYENIEKFRKMMKILDPFSNELGRLWDLSKGDWHAIGLDILSQFAALLEKQDAIQKLAEMLGRLHEAEKELEEQEIEVEKIRYARKIDHSQKSEIVSVHESDDLQYCLPQELVMLGSPDTEMLFYLKFAEKKLLTYQLINRTSEKVHYSERQTAWLPGKNKRGPIIICVDTSGSMHGTPEIVAKTMCFALLRIALLENRQCFLISFSTAIETLELTNFNRSYASLIQFLTHSFYGGTDATPALAEALHQINSKNYEKADVLMVSDFIMDQVGAQVMQGIESAKKNGTKFHSLVVSSNANPSVLEIFDNSWIYDPDSKTVITQMVQNLRLKV